MANETGNKISAKWDLEVIRKINREDSLEGFYFSGQRKILQLKMEMKNNTCRNTRHKIRR